MIDFDATTFGLTPPAITTGHAQCFDNFGVTRYAPSILRRTIGVVQIGEACYRLRNPLTLTFYPFIHEGKGELIPEPDSPTPEGWGVIGTGVTFDDAYNDWAAKLHVLVQNLLAKRQWEMTPEEAREMVSIEQTIDIPAYHRETPYKTRQIGTVTRSRPVPDRIKWEDGRVEQVILDQMPPDFATFVNGQRFEAITVRDSIDGHLLRVDYVGKLKRLKPASSDRWEKAQTFLEAPTIGWDEID